MNMTLGSNRRILFLRRSAICLCESASCCRKNCWSWTVYCWCIQKLFYGHLETISMTTLVRRKLTAAPIVMSFC